MLPDDDGCNLSTLAVNRQWLHAWACVGIVLSCLLVVLFVGPQVPKSYLREQPSTQALENKVKQKQSSSGPVELKPS
jgi:steroid 5-alpha reductase family enzyme